jgi:hypothetical protein
VYHVLHVGRAAFTRPEAGANVLVLYWHSRALAGEIRVDVHVVDLRVVPHVTLEPGQHPMDIVGALGLATVRVDLVGREYSKEPAARPSAVGHFRTKPPIVSTNVDELPSVSGVLPTRLSRSVVLRPTNPAGAFSTA